MGSYYPARAEHNNFSTSGEITHYIAITNGSRGVLATNLNICRAFNSAAGCHGFTPCNGFHTHLGDTMNNIPTRAHVSLGWATLEVLSANDLQALLNWTEVQNFQMQQDHEEHIRTVNAYAAKRV